MASGWDSFVSGFTNAAGKPPPGAKATSAPETAETPSSPWESLIGGFSTRKPRSTGETSVDYDFVVRGLTERGLPQHVAEGFAMNTADESNFDAGINELEPIVKGSRGGFGLNQWTGPRRRQLESYAQERGVDVADPDLQLDFLVWELENTEKRAAEKIFSASTAGEAGAAIVNNFLRPAESHRKKRASKYLGMGGRPKPRPSNRLWLDL